MIMENRGKKSIAERNVGRADVERCYNILPRNQRSGRITGNTLHNRTAECTRAICYVIGRSKGGLVYGCFSY